MAATAWSVWEVRKVNETEKWNPGNNVSHDIDLHSSTCTRGIVMCSCGWAAHPHALQYSPLIECQGFLVLEVSYYFATPTFLFPGGTPLPMFLSRKISPYFLLGTISKLSANHKSRPGNLHSFYTVLLLSGKRNGPPNGGRRRQTNGVLWDLNVSWERRKTRMSPTAKGWAWIGKKRKESTHNDSSRWAWHFILWIPSELMGSKIGHHLTENGLSERYKQGILSKDLDWHRKYSRYHQNYPCDEVKNNILGTRSLSV